MKTKIILFSVLALLFAACNNNEPEKGSQSYTINELTFTYYLSDLEGNIKNTFSKEEWLVVHLNIENNSRYILLAHVDNLGNCYNSQGQFMEEMSTYIFNDTLPAYKTILTGETSCFTYAFFTSISSGLYHYQNPQVSLSSPDNEGDKNEYIIPLTTNFKVQ